MMNCKKGDLVIQIKSHFEGNVGAIRRVVERDEFYPEYWIVEPPAMAGSEPCFSVRDDYLRPIRDTDGEDEMLRITGKPEKKPVKA